MVSLPSSQQPFWASRRSAFRLLVPQPGEGQGSGSVASGLASSKHPAVGPPRAAPELLAHLPCGKTSGAGTRPSRAPNPTPQSRFQKELPFTLPEGRLTSSPLLAPTCSLMSPTSCRCASCLSRARTPVSVASPKPWDGAPLPAEASSSSTPCIPAALRAPGPPRGGTLVAGPHGPWSCLWPGQQLPVCRLGLMGSREAPSPQKKGTCLVAETLTPACFSVQQSLQPAGQSGGEATQMHLRGAAPGRRWTSSHATSTRLCRAAQVREHHRGWTWLTVGILVEFPGELREVHGASGSPLGGLTEA